MSNADHWDATYRRGEVQLSWYQPEPAATIAGLDALAVGRGCSLVDIGGGASRLVDTLLARGHRDITVLDVSPTALGIAQQRLGSRATEVKWVSEDVTTWRPARTYEVWHDRAVFHFLIDPVDQDRYLDTLRASVSDTGLVVMATFAPDGPDQCSNLPVTRYDAATLAARLGDDFVVEVATREEHRTPGGAVQPFTWIGARCIRTARREAARSPWD